MKREKILRSHTIIPQHLYVERSADAHLRRIVEDMGRPGYILVARQMGKTNLLLNAKRTLGGELDKFVYLDVSNTFPDIRQFFRNIIDVAISSYSSEFSSAAERIKQNRLTTGSELPPHKEHENELRELLRHISGRIVICLDEIDALTKTTYADLVFSLIRSIYFSGRVNIPEFDRLTYILSGVAEPAELIKNKDVSPFNIGEKIFLDDFSRLEFGQFLQKANLHFAKEVQDKIFQWTNGNPRMSWDICSALEDILIEDSEISAETVDRLVREMYLTNFDRPPIDHIRKLVEGETLVRDAIMAIHYEKSESISDAMRTKLYLAGITRPSRDAEREVKIRNPILLESLSDSWILDLERKSLSLFDLADKKYKEGLYAQALPIFMESISSQTNKTDLGLTYYRIGECHFKLFQYGEAIKSFDKTAFGKGSTAPIYFAIEHMLGLSYIFIGKPDESIKHFRNVLDQDKSSDEPLTLYFDACINISTALFSDFDNTRDEIISINESVIDSESLVRQSENSNYPAESILYAANYNLALAYKKLGDLELARKYFRGAIDLADQKGKIALMVELIVVSEGLENRRELLEKCIQIVLDNKIEVRAADTSQLLGLTPEVCSRLIGLLQENGCDYSLDKFITHLFDNGVQHSVDTEDLVSKAIMGMVAKGNHELALPLIRKILDLPSFEHDREFRRSLFTIGVFLSERTGTHPLGDEYIREYITPTGSSLIPADYRIIWGLVQKHIADGNLEAARLICNRTNELSTEDNHSDLDEHSEGYAKSIQLVIDALEFDLLLAEGMTSAAKQNVASILARLEEASSITLPYFGDDFLKVLRRKVRNSFMEMNAVVTIRRTDKKIGRNEIVTVYFQDGRIAKGKYKKFQDQLSSGACNLSEDN